MKNIPITILTGFLGSGKTTLLNHLFEKYPNKKFAIIENEFGSMSIDHELITHAKEGIFELANGCVCCSLSDDLKKTLNKLLTQSYEFDHVLIETTGIADPSAVVSSIINDVHFQGIFSVDGVVALADAPNLEKVMDKEVQVKKQLGFADAILINKVDQLQENEIQEVENVLNQLNPLAKKEKTTYAQFSELDILNLAGYKIKTVEEQTNQVNQEDAHLYDHEIMSFTFTFDQAFDFEKLSNWLNAILLINAGSIYRIKGILDIQGQAKKIVLQSVYTDYVMGKGSEWGKEPKKSKIVFIGKKLDKLSFQESLKSCWVSL